MKHKKYKIAIVVSHPIQYQVPLYTQLAVRADIDVTVYYCWNFCCNAEAYDPGFGKKIQWDIPLLEGYTYRFLPNWSWRPSSSLWGQINPGIVRALYDGQYDAVWIHGYMSITAWFACIGAWVSRTPIFIRSISHSPVSISC